MGGCAIAAALTALIALAPSASAAPPLQSFFPAGFAWKLAGSHGYEITVGAGAETLAGRGYVTLTVRRPGSYDFASYRATATTPNRSSRARWKGRSRFAARAASPASAPRGRR